MKPVVVGSLTRSAGKTSVIIGLARAGGQPFAYLKPFGDRLLYRKKRQWDYDAALLANLFRLEEIPELITLGFDHSKLRFMYDAATTAAKLQEMAAAVQRTNAVFFVEGGRDLSYGSSVHLDPLTVAASLQARLLLVLSGNEAELGDQLTFLRRHVQLAGVDFAGVIVNKVKDPAEFEAMHLADLRGLGVPILGVLPYQPVLTEFPASYLAEQLFARIIAGERGSNRVIRNVFLATVSVPSAQHNPGFSADGTLVVTSGDRSDMVVAAIESNAAAVLLTDDIAPPPNVLSNAEDRGIPLLLVRYTTAQAARKLGDLDPLLTRDDTAKVTLLGDLVRQHVDLGFLRG